MVGRESKQGIIDEDAARSPVVYRAKTGGTLPQAFWMVATAFKAMDDLAVEAVCIHCREKPVFRSREPHDRVCDKGCWFETVKFSDLFLWISYSEMEVWTLLEARRREIVELTSIFRATAPETADAMAALAAMETAGLDPWPDDFDGDVPPAPYQIAAHWLDEHAHGEPDPSFITFRASIRYLVNRPFTLNAALEGAEAAFR